ncbi:MAG: class I SAM-dependent methyltransferase [Succinivibrio sp.]
MFNKIAAGFIFDYLKRFDKYPFSAEAGGRTVNIGSGEPLFKIIFHDDIPKAKLLTSTSLALGDAYIDKKIELEGDLFTALSCLLSQADKFALKRRSLSILKLLNPSESEKNQKKEVSSHYDLGNDFYKLWLDPTMTYSCAYFKNDGESLEQAQRDKVHHILEKLCLKPGMTLLDIGCGWGYLLIEAAKQYGIEGYGCTLSKEQYAKGCERVREAGLEGKVHIELVDYRDLPARGMTFDRLVSVGMLEHVGRKNYKLYMETCSKLLKDKGLFLLHYISGGDEVSANPWIRKHIFPGGTIPSLREIIYDAYEPGVGFMVLDVESLRRHYYKTLMCWYDNFQKVRDQVMAKRGEAFCRMWDLYLCGCAAAFELGNVDLHQILFSKGANNDLPMTRWF